MLVGLVEIKAIFKLLQWLKAQIIIRRLKVETVEEFQMVQIMQGCPKQF